MTNESQYVRRTIELAKESLERGGFPAGALIVKDGKVIAEGISIGNILHDPTSHAEIAAIREACKTLQTANLESTILYESLQSCMMCYSAANWAGIPRIVTACRKTQEMITKGFYEGTAKIQELNLLSNRQIELDYILDFEQESLNLLKSWEVNLLQDK